ncbi:hypothetical protein ABT115_15875 [Streptomyces sp. NPDC001832]|uniref:hypothetical protein n=1 Tax=Streptomyces sp. NPDC001832 TaxID=3154527 RepID=UPI0033277F50
MAGHAGFPAATPGSSPRPYEALARLTTIVLLVRDEASGHRISASQPVSAGVVPVGGRQGIVPA